MRAMILAAGRGERMRPLTDTRPKPLLEVNGRPLLDWHIRALAQAGIIDIVINHAWLGEQIVEYFGTGSQYGVRIQYSAEEEALETAGGVHQALPLLGDAPFILLNADIWTDFDFNRLKSKKNCTAHLVMVHNPTHHPDGDFSLRNDLLYEAGSPKYTYSGIGLYAPAFFARIPEKKYPLAPLLRDAMQQEKVSGELYTGTWADIGTPARLAELNCNVSETKEVN